MLYITPRSRRSIHPSIVSVFHPINNNNSNTQFCPFDFLKQRFETTLRNFSSPCRFNIVLGQCLKFKIFKKGFETKLKVSILFEISNLLKYVTSVKIEMIQNITRSANQQKTIQQAFINVQT